MNTSNDKLARLVEALQQAVVGAERDRPGLVQPQVRRPAPPRAGLSRT